MKVIPTRLKSWLRSKFNSSPDGVIRVTWLIFIVTGPFLINTLWHQNLIAWLAMVGAGMWAFTFSNAYLNRMYWRNYQLQNQNLHEMLDTISQAYYLLHEHCPNCGSRLKPPPEVRQ
jgi:Flp pilus assembly protein TadB